MSYLLDTNVILRWVNVQSTEHATAVAKIQALRSRGESLFITAQNLLEFWSVATRPASVNGLGFTPGQADADVQAIEQFFPLLPDHATIHTHWRRLVVSHSVSGRQVHDARLVAVMLAHHVSHLLTFNASDFARYDEIAVVDIVASPPVQLPR
jgi:predicted nucleic acid-binding protein